MKAMIDPKKVALAALVLISGAMSAGNEDRAGQAGATELLINPWARSSGWGGANSAFVRGLEAQFLNVAGTAFTKKTEMLFTRTSWLVGTDIHIAAFGFTQKVGSTGVLGLGIMSMNFGEIDITTTELPEGGIGTYSPQFMNIGLSYAKTFSDNIYGGMNLKIISESISDLKARGVALDAGIQYVAGKYDQIKFGIALKNVGPRLKFEGDGLSFKTPLPNGNAGTMTVEQRSEPFELPSLINIGFGYDFYFASDSANMKTHRLTTGVNFTSNSFSKDELRIGLEYAYKSWIMVHAGYSYEKGIMNKEDRTTAFTGPSAGFTVELPFGKNGSTFGLDYSYRFTNPFSGCHAIGARINL
ncbi:MAG: PorV/PorQ family protein [Bacteroidia bacterium]|nr:PorV/PorQ family protein [Bacteroidia bacterium]